MIQLCGQNAVRIPSESRQNPVRIPSESRKNAVSAAVRIPSESRQNPVSIVSASRQHRVSIPSALAQIFSYTGADKTKNIEFYEGYGAVEPIYCAQGLFRGLSLRLFIR